MTDAADAAGRVGTEPAGGTGELKGTPYELFMLLVSLLTIVNTVIVLIPFDDAIQEVALLVDVLIAPLFLVDFLYRLRTAPSRTRYVVREWGWADLLAVVPFFGVLRLFRVARVVRLLQAYGRPQIATDLDRARATATFLLTLYLVIVVVEFAGMAMFAIESRAPGGNIKSAGDAVWWGFVTITTVGYGDQYPTTAPGRIVGTLLLFAGIALFSVLTGFIANVFLAPREPKKRLLKPAPDSLEAQVDDLRQLLMEQEQHAALIRRKLESLERAARERKKAIEAGRGPGPR